MPRRFRGRLWWWPWAIVALLLAAYLPAQIRLNDEFDQSSQSVSAEHYRLKMLDQEAIYSTRRLYQSLTSVVGRSPTDIEVQETLAFARFKQVDQLDRVQAWQDPKGGVVWIESGVRGSVIVRSIPEDRGPPFPDRQAGTYGVMTVYRQWASLVLYVSWLIGSALFGIPMTKRSHFRLAVHLFLLAVLGSVLGSLGPDYLSSGDLFFRADAPGWGMVLGAVSLVAVLVCLYRRRHLDNSLVCRFCHCELIDNLSGRCSECGEHIPEAQSQILAVNHIRRHG